MPDRSHTIAAQEVDPLEWARNRVDEVWEQCWSGFKNWVVFCCDGKDAADIDWLAPEWLLSQAPELLRNHILGSDPPADPAGRLPTAHTNLILGWIAYAIHNDLRRTRKRLLLAARAGGARKRPRYSASSLEGLNEGVRVIRQTFIEEWETKRVETAEGLHTKLQSESELNAEIFNAGLTAWRKWNIELQTRLWARMVNIARANRKLLGVRLEAVGPDTKTKNTENNLLKQVKQKPGPPTKMDRHLAIAEIVSPYGLNWKEESHLEQIAEKLDEHEIIPPEEWRILNPPAKTWERAIRRIWGKDRVKKALEYALKKASEDTIKKP